MRRGRVLFVALLLLALAAPTAPVVAQSSDSITWGEDNDLVTLDPRVSQSRHEAQVIMQMFEALIFLDTEGKYHPWLAESWELAKDGTSMTFKLRRDVKFHDGTPFNAQAVKFTFDSIQDPKLGSQAAIDFLGPYAGTDIVDPYTIRIRWKQPYSPAINNLSNPWVLGIVSPAAVQRLGNDGFARSPVGTGPFKFVEWVPRQRIVLERNADYKWPPKVFRNTGPARFSRLAFRIIPDASTRTAALERREIDVMDQLPPIEVRRFRSRPDYDVMIGDVSGIPYGYSFNTSREPTNDVRVRRAFMHAVNRPQVVEQTFFGAAKPAYGPITPTTPGYWKDAEQYFPFDQAKARQMLDEAGWRAGPGGIRQKDGKPLELYFPVLLQPELAIPIQAQVREVGISLKVENVTKAKQDELIFANDYHVLPIRWVAVDPSVLSVLFQSRNIPSPGKFKFNWNRFGSPELDRMLNEADGATEPARRARLLQGVQKFILDRALIFPINMSFQPVGYRKAVTGLKFAQGQWQVLFYDAQIAR
jgi:peptide/nickel transport system substrate-binding protein